ncbi:hypothetical protein K439DRAFT_1622847 [Ramaria rubella]|nr:hypothetical protein K439DRAFT_1622847 [Ramaria rubella]
MKMIWALDPIMDSPESISTKAAFVTNTLHYIQQSYDVVLNRGAFNPHLFASSFTCFLLGIKEEHYPKIHSFTQRDKDGNYYILVNSKSLFDNIPFTSSGSPVKLDKGSIGSGLSTTKAPVTSTTGHSFCAKTPLLGIIKYLPNLPVDSHELTLANMPDPSNQFSSIRSIATDVKINLLNICDHDGKVISPLAYSSKLVNGCLVDVIVTCRIIQGGTYVKMQLIPTTNDSVQVLLSPLTATTAANSSKDSSSKITTRSSNIVPDANISSNITTGSSNIVPDVNISSNITETPSSLDMMDSTPATSISKIQPAPTVIPATPSYSKVTSSRRKRNVNASEKTGNAQKVARTEKVNEKDKDAA